MKLGVRASLAVATIALVSLRADAQSRPWSVRVAESVMKRNPVVYDSWDYTAGLVLLALDRIGARAHDPKFAAYIKKSVDSLVHADGSIATYAATEYNLDQINEGRTLFPLADRTHDPRYNARPTRSARS